MWDHVGWREISVREVRQGERVKKPDAKKISLETTTHKLETTFAPRPCFIYHNDKEEQSFIWFIATYINSCCDQMEMCVLLFFFTSEVFFFISIIYIERNGMVKKLKCK